MAHAGEVKRLVIKNINYCTLYELNRADTLELKFVEQEKASQNEADTVHKKYLIVDSVHSFMKGFC